MTPALILLAVLIAGAGYAIGYRDGHADALDTISDAAFDRELAELLDRAA